MVRDKNGRFSKGHSGNPGGKKPSEVNITALIDECVTPQDWKAMIIKVADFAKKGNLKCVEWLTDRRFGKPLQSHEIGNKESGTFSITIVERPYGSQDRTVDNPDGVPAM